MRPLASTNQPGMPHDWRNPQWLEDSSCDEWWNDVDAPRGRNSNGLDQSGSSQMRWEKERELNELIAKGLKNLNELRQTDSRNSQPILKDTASQVPAHVQQRGPSPMRQTSIRQSTSSPSMKPTQVSAPRRAPSPSTPRQTSWDRTPRSAAPRARARSQSPAPGANRFAFFHSGETPRSARSQTSHLYGHAPQVHLRSPRSTLPPRPPLAKRLEVPSPNLSRKITQQELNGFYARQEELQNRRRMNREPSPEPDHVPRIGGGARESVQDIWGHLYDKGLKRTEKQTEMLKQAEEMKKKREEDELANMCPFVPQISQTAQQHTTGSSVFQRLSKADCNHRRKNLETLVEDVDKKQLLLCPFKPRIHETGNRREEDQEEFVERLHKEAEELKAKIEEKRNMVKAIERNRIEAEHRKADHHYARKAQRKEEREKERRLRNLELAGSAIPSEFRRPSRESNTGHLTDESAEEPSQHDSYPRFDAPPPRRDNLQPTRRHPVLIEPVASESKYPNVRADSMMVFPTVGNEQVRRQHDDEQRSDISRSTNESSNSTERVIRPHHMQSHQRDQEDREDVHVEVDEPTETVKDEQGEASDDEYDEAAEALRDADRRRITQSTSLVPPAPAPAHIVSEEDLWASDEETEAHEY